MTTPRYIGRVNFAPQDPQHPRLWQLEEPFAQITKDGHIIICRPWERTDGASIPRSLWPILGHPFEGSNKFWSQPHDQGYHGTALVIRLADLHEIAPESLIAGKPRDGYVYELFKHLHVEKPRKWFDASMFEAMGLSGEPLPMRVTAWAGVRCGGWKGWHKR